MLHEFLTVNRQLLISRCREKVATRGEPSENLNAIDHGVPVFLQQLVDTLRGEQSTRVRGLTAERTPANTEIGRAAALHGAELLRRGFSIDQVVHDYGDVCQCVTALAVEREENISTDEFRTLNRCIDNAIADAVSAFGNARDASLEHSAQTAHQRLAVFAIEHRRLVDIAMQSLSAIKTGNIGISGATGNLLAHSLKELRSLTDRSLPDLLQTAASASVA